MPYLKGSVFDFLSKRKIQARLEDHLIQTLGRWSSDCYTRYIHTSPEVLRQAQAQLVATFTK
jgi:L-lactate utilization protein LutC